mmetsp:Transcript_7772/g.14793  ORF Transcript_7772/g.14793 Transcript_7772/m.14793 type:complete len:219 (+) Transcript_7772:78-734(+)
MKVTLPMILALSAATASEGRRYRVVSSSPLQAHRQALDASFELVTDMLQNSPIYKDLTNTLLTRDFGDTTTTRGATANTYHPRYAVSQDGGTGATTLRMELPGVSATDLDIHVENDSLLRIQGKRRHALLDDTVMEFEQSFQLDSDVDPASLKVTLSHGILQVKASKRVKKVQRLEIIQAHDDDDDMQQSEAATTTPVGIEGTTEETGTEGITITEEA